MDNYREHTGVVVLFLLACFSIILLYSIFQEYIVDSFSIFNNPLDTASLIVIRQSDYEDYVNPGDLISVTVEVINAGGIKIEDLTINETMPNGFVLVDDRWSVNDKEIEENPVYEYEVGSLETGDQMTLTYSVYISSFVNEDMYNISTYSEGISHGQKIPSNIVDTKIKVKEGKLVVPASITRDLDNK